MQKRRRLILILVGVAVLVGMVVLGALREREPEYGGKKLSEWLARYKDPPIIMTFTTNSGYYLNGKAQQTPGPSSDEAADAIRLIGTNALPFLVAWINYETPARKEWSLNTSVKLRAKSVWYPPRT